MYLHCLLFFYTFMLFCMNACTEWKQIDIWLLITKYSIRLCTSIWFGLSFLCYNIFVRIYIYIYITLEILSSDISRQLFLRHTAFSDLLRAYLFIETILHKNFWVQLYHTAYSDLLYIYIIKIISSC